MADRVFKIVPASSWSYAWFGAVFLILLVPFYLLLMLCCRGLDCSAAGFWLSLFGLISVISIAVVFMFFAYSAYNSKVVLNEKGLTVKTFIYGRTLPRGSVLRSNISKLDLKTQRVFRPVIRTNGIGMPGYQAGWFRLAGREKALLVVTDRSNVVYLPAVEGYSLLLSVAEPEKFIESINELWRI